MINPLVMTPEDVAYAFGELAKILSHPAITNAERGQVADDMLMAMLTSTAGAKLQDITINHVADGECDAAEWADWARSDSSALRDIINDQR